MSQQLKSKANPQKTYEYTCILLLKISHFQDTLSQYGYTCNYTDYIDSSPNYPWITIFSNKKLQLSVGVKRSIHVCVVTFIKIILEILQRFREIWYVCGKKKIQSHHTYTCTTNYTYKNQFIHHFTNILGYKRRRLTKSTTA